MARTRGASNVHHDDDGILVDKEGKPINAPAGVQHMDDGELVVAEKPVALISEPPPSITRFVCHDGTLQRNLDGWELAKLLNIAMGGALEISMQPDEFARLPADLRRHFKPVRGE